MQGPGGNAHPRVPFLLSRGRALLGALDERAQSTDSSQAMSTRYVDDVGNMVKALWTPLVRKLVITVYEQQEDKVVPEAVKAKGLQVFVWQETNRDILASENMSGDYTSVRMARITFSTPSGELVRLLHKEQEMEPEPKPPVGGDEPDTEWEEVDRVSKRVDFQSEFYSDPPEPPEGEGFETVQSVTYRVRVQESPEAYRRVGLEYRGGEGTVTDATVWTEAFRTEQYLLINETVKALRVLSVTFRRIIEESDGFYERLLSMVYKEGQQDFEYIYDTKIIEIPQQDASTS